MGTALTVALIILGLFLALLGIIGCLFPVIPGPPISFVALLVLSYAKNWEAFSVTFLIVMGVLTVVVVVLDYVVPAGGAKKYGASKTGVAGSLIGMLAGVFFFPPWGLFVGAFVGASVGELIARKGGKEALRAGWGVFVGIMVGTGLKLAFTGVILFFYIKELIYG
ncbi:MAG: DUF456 domain-containing protein [Deltaproteobacteria bacterium]|nr:DUF456 domain-containing protein [Deltaproteobacteria bacterium]